MLHGYKKSRYNIYDNLEFLGLNPYEQKHFCFGEGGGEGGGSADDYEQTTGFKDDPETAVDPDDPTSLSTDPPGLTAEEAEEAVGQANVAMSLAGLNPYDNPEAAQVALDVASANVAGYDIGSFSDAVSQATPSTDELDALEQVGLLGYNEKAALGYVDTLQQEQRASELAAARALEQKYGFERGQVTPAFMTDPTGVQTASFKGPGAVGAVVNEVARGAANLALNVVQMAPTVGNIGMQIARDQGLFGLDKKSFAEQAQDKVNQAFDQRAATMRADNLAARGITEPETLAEQVAAAPEGYNPAIGMADPTLSGLPGVSYEGAPFSGPKGSFEEMSERAAAKGFNEYQANLAALAASRAADVDPYGNLYAAPAGVEQTSLDYFDLPSVEQTSVDYFDPLDYDYLGADDGTVTKTKKQVKTTPVVEEVDVAQATPVAFPNIDTIPPSRISRIARIYNISEDAAKRMLGVA